VEGTAMAKKFDLIVVGAGPTGLMAAKVAGENGLKVALIDKKHDIPEIKRACGEVIDINEYSWGDFINFNAKKGLLNFPVNGFNVSYKGPYKNIYGMYNYSPGGEYIMMGDCSEARKSGDAARKGIAIDKEVLLRGLLEEARKNDVEIIPGTFIHEIEKKGETVVVSDGNREFEGVFVIASDGLNSKITQRLGFNKEREFRGTLRCLFWYVMGIETPAPDALIHVTGGKGAPALFGICCTHREGEYWIAVDDFSYKADLAAGADYVMKKDAFAPWFKKLKKIRTTSCVGNLYSPIEEPFKDNVLLVGDAVYSPQISINGGMICGLKAANAVVLALLEGNRNKEGVESYLNWWKKDIIDRFPYAGGNFMESLEDSEVDYLFSLFKETLPGTLDPTTAGKYIQEHMMNIMPTIGAEHPEILQKLQKFQTKTSEERYAERLKSGFPNR
jgi:flavin-dependent dehydrogenase